MQINEEIHLPESVCRITNLGIGTPNGGVDELSTLRVCCHRKSGILIQKICHVGGIIPAHWL
jgi:hypothetical protein